MLPDADARVVPVEAVVALDDGPAVAGQVVDDADARREHVPGEEVGLGERLRRDRRRGPTRAAELLLLRQAAL